MFPTEAWNPELRQLMERTFGAACREIDVASIREYGKAAETMMALRIMTTVAAGERDPGRLKELALQAVDGRMTDNRRASSAPCETALPSHVTRSIDPPPDSSREKRQPKGWG